MKGDEENTNRKLYINVLNYKDQNQSNLMKTIMRKGKRNNKFIENFKKRETEHPGDQANTARQGPMIHK